LDQHCRTYAVSHPNDTTHGSGDDQDLQGGHLLGRMALLTRSAATAFSYTRWRWLAIRSRTNASSAETPELDWMMPTARSIMVSTAREN
jgi:hypothetical protein